MFGINFLTDFLESIIHQPCLPRYLKSTQANSAADLSILEDQASNIVSICYFILRHRIYVICLKIISLMETMMETIIHACHAHLPNLLQYDVHLEGIANTRYLRQRTHLIMKQSLNLMYSIIKYVPT